jgi:DNA helicase II / ATP-dependent DNA helicase PcrA
LLVDWKTNRTDKDGSKHRQQLALYKKAYSILEGYHEEKINIAVAYVGLRNNINDGNTNLKFNDSKPRSTAIDTITSKIKKINEWRNNPVLFIEELKTAEEESTLLRVIKEELA